MPHFAFLSGYCISSRFAIVVASARASRERRGWAQPRDRAYPAAIAISSDATLERERLPQLRTRREDEVVTHHADDRVRRSVQLYGATDDGRVATEPTLPQRMAENHAISVAFQPFVVP